jgi:hypothetical protein
MRAPFAVLASGWISVLAVAAACGKSDEPPASKPAEGGEGGSAAPGTEKKKRSNVKKFVAPVPYGKQVACANLVDAAKFATYIGDELGEVKDKSDSNLEATSVCAFFRAGTPPSEKEQQRAFNKNAMKLGVLPGDEYCTLTAFCSYPAELEEFKKKCQADGHREDGSLGQFACVREYQRASDKAFTYRVIDAETQCIFEVMGGPSVTDETLVQNCTRAALETIGPQNIATLK